MLQRALQPRVARLLEQFPAVAILGPRQVGKTTLALSLAETLAENALYLDLELPSDRAKLSDPELYLNQHEDRLVILDEIHRLPGLFESKRKSNASFGAVMFVMNSGDECGHRSVICSS